MRSRPLSPQIYMADYCTWIVLSILPLLTVAALTPIESVDGNRLRAAVLTSCFSIACLCVVLMRGRRARRLATRIMSRGDMSWALAFDEAQIQDSDGTPLRSFDDGALSVDANGVVGIWTVSSHSRETPDVSFAPADLGEARIVHAYRLVAYPTISVQVSPASALVVRPLKPRGLPWRVGMTVKEAKDAAERLSSGPPTTPPGSDVAATRA